MSLSVAHAFGAMRQNVKKQVNFRLNLKGQLKVDLFGDSDSIKWFPVSTTMCNRRPEMLTTNYITFGCLPFNKAFDTIYVPVPLDHTV